MKKILANYHTNQQYDTVVMTAEEKQQYFTTFQKMKAKNRCAGRKSFYKAAVIFSVAFLGISATSAMAGGFGSMVNRLVSAISAEKGNTLDEHMVGVDEKNPNMPISGEATLVQGTNYDMLFEQVYCDGLGQGAMIVRLLDKNGNGLQLTSREYEIGYITPAGIQKRVSSWGIDGRIPSFITFTGAPSTGCAGLYVKVFDECFELKSNAFIHSEYLEWTTPQGKVKMGNLGFVLDKDSELNQRLRERLFKENCSECVLTITYTDGTSRDVTVIGYGGYGDYSDETGDSWEVSVTLGLYFSSESMLQMIANKDISLLGKELFIDIGRLESITLEDITLYAKDAKICE